MDQYLTVQELSKSLGVDESTDSKRIKIIRLIISEETDIRTFTGSREQVVASDSQYFEKYMKTPINNNIT